MGGVMMRGLVSCAILGATALSFNLIAAAPSGATTSQLSSWFQLNGQIRDDPSLPGFAFGNEGAGTGTCPAGTVDVPGTHGLFNCGSPDPGFNPNAPVAVNGDGSIISRSFLTDPQNQTGTGQSTVGCAGDGDTTTYTSSGAKVGLGPLYTTGHQPNTKEDLSNVYVVARTQQTGQPTVDPSPGDKEVYFGLERAGQGGDEAVDIEFLQGSVSMAGCTGPLTVHREQGDFVVEFDWINGGGSPSPQVLVWTCGAPAGGAPVATTATPCDNGGSSYPSAAYVPLPDCSTTLTSNCVGPNTLKLANDATETIPGTTPPVPGVLCGGWVCANTVGTNSSGVDPSTPVVPQTQFVEGGIDLAGLGLQGTCASTILPTSHESQAFGSDAKDFAGPAGFNLCANTSTTTSPTNDAGGPSIGGSWHDTATVTNTSNPSGNPPTGSVTFYSCSPSVLLAHSATSCNSTIGTEIPSSGITNPVALTTGTPSANSSTAISPSITVDAAGTWCFAGYYGGVPGVFMGSNDTSTGNECFTVNPVATTTLTTANPSSVTLGSSGTVSDSVTVSSNGSTAAGPPTGTVAFYVCHTGTSDGPCANVPGNLVPGTGNPATLVAGAATSPTFTPNAAGTWCFSAVYSGDANYATSLDNTSGEGVPAECVMVSKGSSTTVTTASPSSITLSPEGTVSDSVTVSSTSNPPGPTPSGTVTFYVCHTGTSDGPCANISANLVPGTGNPATLDGGAAISPTFTPTAAGTWCFSAVYSGDDNYMSSVDNTSTEGGVPAECVTVGQGPSTTVTQQSGSATGQGTITIGGTITDSATVSSTSNPPGPTPSGTVTFYVCHTGTSIGSCANTSTNLVPGTGNPATLDGGAATSPTFTPNATGIWCFSAVYSGDDNYVSSPDNTSGDGVPSECFLVTTPDFRVLKTDVPGDGNPVVPGSTIPYTVTIQNIGNGPGTVTVSDTLPSNLTIVSPGPVCSVTGCIVTNTTGSTWTFTMPLAASGSTGDTGTVTFNATVAATDTADVVNTATITAGVCDNGQAASVKAHAAVNNCSSTVTNPVPDFTVTKTDAPGNNTPVAAGATIPYTVAIKNVSATSGSATITDTLPSSLTIQGTPACAVTGSDTCKVTNTSGSTWTFDVALAAGDTATGTFSAVVAATTTGNVVNTATITTGPCNTSSGCASTVTNPVIVTAPAVVTPTTTTVPPVTQPATIAFTGADIAGMVAGGLALLGLGGLMVMLARRRRQAGEAG